MKLKTSATKDTHQWDKATTYKMGKYIFANSTYDRGLKPKIHKELKTLDIKTPNEPFKLDHTSKQVS